MSDQSSPVKRVTITRHTLERDGAEPRSAPKLLIQFYLTGGSGFTTTGFTYFAQSFTMSFEGLITWMQQRGGYLGNISLADTGPFDIMMFIPLNTIFEIDVLEDTISP